MLRSCICLAACLLQEPATLEVGKAVAGVLEGEATFALQVKEPGPYTLSLRSFDFDAYLVLMDSQGVVLVEDDNSGHYSDASFHWQLTAGKKYQVVASAQDGAKGTFQLECSAGEPPKLSAEEQWHAGKDNRLQRVTHAKEKFGEVSAEVATLRNELAMHYYRAGFYDEAQQQMEVVVSIRKEVFGADHALTADGLNNLASFYYFQGKYESAVNSFERCLAIWEATIGTENARVATCLNNLGSLKNLLGDYSEAQELFERSLQIRLQVLGPDHPDVGTSLNNLASLFQDLGRFEEARPLYEQCIALREKVLGAEHPSTATVLSNFGTLLKDQGNWVDAMAVHRRALAIKEKVLGDQHPEVATSLENVAHLLSLQGELEASLELFRRCLRIRERSFGSNHYRVADALNHIGWVQERLGDLAQAQRHYQRSSQISEAVLGPNHANVGIRLSNLGSLLLDLEEFDQAITALRRAVAILESNYDQGHPSVVTSLNQLASALQKQGKRKEAFELRRRALAAALEHLDQQLPTMSEAGRLEFLQRAANPEHFLAAVLAADEPDAMQAYSLFQNWKGKATRLQAAEVRLGQFGQRQDLANRRAQIQAVAKELSELVLLPLNQQAEDHGEKIQQLRSERLRFERELNREIGLGLVLETPDAGSIQAGLPEEAILVDLFVGDQVYAWITQPVGDPVLICLGDNVALEQAADDFLHRTNARGASPLSVSGQAQSKSLWQLLWQPLAEFVGTAQTIFLSPDGFLCELPFGILQNRKGDFLLEQHRFIYLFDATLLAGKEEQSTSQEGSLLAVGGVNYFRRDDLPASFAESGTSRSRSNTKWKSLPGTRDEVRALRDMHEFILEWDAPLTLIEGKAATEERILSELPGKKYLHLATHGYFEPEELPSLLLDAAEKQVQAQIGEQIRAVGLLPGLLSGLVFAGVNAEPDPSREDGYLCAEEIMHIDLSSCDLVVLSACETALGSSRAGEGLMSLRRAFSVAGADAVISSLWKVDDEATSELMNDFYTNLWEKGMPRGVALHAAKLRMLQRNRIENDGDARPGTWGAFVLSGEWD